MEESPRKWQGIEAIFEAYREYADGESMSSFMYVAQSCFCLRGLKGFTE